MSESNQPVMGTPPSTEGLPGLSQEEKDLLVKVFSSPLDIPQEWKSWLISYLEANPPVLPISQIFGFTAFTASAAEIPGKQNMPSNGSFVDLATVGPQLTAMPKGSYVLLWGAAYDASGGATGAMVPRINGVNPGTVTELDHSALIEPVNVERFNIMRGRLFDLDLESNDITCKYYSTQSPGPAFYKRWLIALKYANL